MSSFTLDVVDLLSMMDRRRCLLFSVRWMATLLILSSIAACDAWSCNRKVSFSFFREVMSLSILAVNLTALDSVSRPKDSSEVPGFRLERVLS